MSTFNGTVFSLPNLAHISKETHPKWHYQGIVSTHTVLRLVQMKFVYIFSWQEQLSLLLHVLNLVFIDIETEVGVFFHLLGCQKQETATREANRRLQAR